MHMSSSQKSHTKRMRAQFNSALYRNRTNGTEIMRLMAQYETFLRVVNIAADLPEDQFLSVLYTDIYVAKKFMGRAEAQRVVNMLESDIQFSSERVPILDFFISVERIIQT